MLRILRCCRVGIYGKRPDLSRCRPDQLTQALNALCLDKMMVVDAIHLRGTMAAAFQWALDWDGSVYTPRLLENESTYTSSTYPYAPIGIANQLLDLMMEARPLRGKFVPAQYVCTPTVPDVVWPFLRTLSCWI